MKTEFSIQQLTEIRSAIIQVIDEGWPCGADGCTQRHTWYLDSDGGSEDGIAEHRKRFLDATQAILTSPERPNRSEHVPDGFTRFVYQGDGWHKEVECEIKDGKIIVPATTIPSPFSEATYRIEKRSDTGQLTEYWRKEPFAWWMENVEYATIYSESERTEFLNKTLRGEPSGFPEGGIWCRVEAEREAK